MPRAAAPSFPSASPRATSIEGLNDRAEGQGSEARARGAAGRGGDRRDGGAVARGTMDDRTGKSLHDPVRSGRTGRVRLGAGRNLAYLAADDAAQGN